MQANVDQRCPSCGTDIHCDTDIAEVSGVGLLRRLTAEWECPECGVAYEQTTPFDTELLERSGFHSWTGSIEDNPACIVVADEGSVFVDNEGNTHDTGH